MRTLRSMLLAGLLALPLLAAPAAAAEGAGRFVTAEDVELWGEVRVAEAPGMLSHSGPAGSLTAQAAMLTVRVTSTTYHPNGTGEREVHDHVYTDATLASGHDASLEVRVAPEAPLTVGAAPTTHTMVVPEDRDAMDRTAPVAVVRIASPQQRDGQGSACGGAACAASPEVRLLPAAPLVVEGRLEATLLPGGAIEVQGSEGARTFRAGSDEVSTREGGVEVPGVGMVGERVERRVVVSEVQVLAREGRLTAQPSVAAGDDPPGRASTVLRFAGDEPGIAVEGALGVRQATGRMHVGGDTYTSERGDVLVAGDLRIALAAVSQPHRPGVVLFAREPDARGGALAVAFEGDIQAVDVQATGAGGGSAVYHATMFAGAAGAAGLMGLMAPALKGALGRLPALLPVPMYARLQKRQLLEHDMRARLLTIIRADPGVSPGELSRQVDCGWSTLVYHLGVLQREGYITKAREGRRWRYFPNGTQHHAALPKLAMMRNRTAARIMAEVEANPGLAQNELSARTALGASTVHWHMGRLQEAGLVRVERDGRCVRYYPGPALAVPTTPAPPPAAQASGGAGAAATVGEGEGAGMASA